MVGLWFGFGFGLGLRLGLGSVGWRIWQAGVLIEGVQLCQ